ncbi:MAG: sigma-54-dependent Fis family transcriptional regulator [Gammaproteobacteria bacterium]|nr:sigma-54-dependent Fis family transcriptional regulator [Gammaproteobacteria bacterium]
MPQEKPCLLIVDDERSHLKILNDILKQAYEMKAALNGKQALERSFSEPKPDLILLDIQMPDMDGFEVLAQLKGDARTKDIPVIFITAMDAKADEAKGLEAGAADYIAKPFLPAIVKARIKTHLSLQRSIREVRETRIQAESLEKQVGALNRSLAHATLKNPDAFREFVTGSPKIFSLFHYMEAIADSGEAVLITGETGTGKEVIAKCLHRLGRPDKSMVPVNLAGLDDTAFSDTLFGHKKGAFTGANQERKGLVSEAEGGTLFLDEIGDLASASQIKLLRLLQEKQYYPLDSDKTYRMNVNIVAATHRNIEGMMQEGQFREDLYYRLSAHKIKIPALRERPEDIPQLVECFLNEATESMNRPALKASAKLLTLLNLYNFPGNIRELRAMIFDAVAQQRTGSTLSMNSIRQALEEKRNTGDSEAAKGDILLLNSRLPTLEEAEQMLISEAMRQAGNNQGIAASLLGISRTALNRRVNRR